LQPISLIGFLVAPKWRQKSEMKLTKRTIDALAPREKDYIEWDAELKGFGVRIMPSGTKTFIIEYRPGSGGRSVNKQKWRLGRYGELAPEQARNIARVHLARIRLGHDPQAERARERAALTVAVLIDAFLESHVGTKRKPKTRVDYGIVLDKLRTAHGNMKAAALKTAQVETLHRSMAATPYQANKLLDAVSSLYTWAERNGHLPEGHPNPARRVVRYREEGRERFLTNEELARLGDALREGETAGLPYDIDESKPKAKHAPKEENRRVVLDPFAAAAIRLLMLTGGRLREILHARWTDVDFQRGLLNLRDSKVGRRPIILNAPALEILASLPRIEGNPHIIPGAKEGEPRYDLRKPWAAVTKAAGLDGLRVHDLRHSHASIGAGAGLSLPIIGKLLGHTQAATTQRYAHLAADPVREASERIGNVISAAFSGRKPDAPALLRRVPK
jgi:integrase